MNAVGISELVSNAINVKVWPDFVPEGESFPAVTYSHITNVKGARLLNGKTDSNSDTWRLSIITKNYADRDTIIKQINALDNSFSNAFKNVFIMNEFPEPADPDSDLLRAFIDLKTIDRGL